MSCMQCVVRISVKLYNNDEYVEDKIIRQDYF